MAQMTQNPVALDEKADKRDASFQPLRRPPGVERRIASLNILATVLTIVGGLATGSALAAMLSWTTLPKNAVIEPVASSEIEAAASSLFGPTRAAAVDAAKSCRRPLALLTVMATGETMGILRFRSGDYLSPKFKVGRNPFRLALPFPAPISAGAGDILIASDTGGAAIFIRPGVVIPLGVHEKLVHVTWNPRLSCAVAK